MFAVYLSQYGHTKLQAEAVNRGVAGVAIKLRGYPGVRTYRS